MEWGAVIACEDYGTLDDCCMSGTRVVICHDCGWFFVVCCCLLVLLPLLRLILLLLLLLLQAGERRPPHLSGGPARVLSFFYCFLFFVQRGVCGQGDQAEDVASCYHVPGGH